MTVPAYAQSGSLGHGIVGAISIDAEQQSQIGVYVEDAVGQMAGGSDALRRRGRDALLGPLGESNISAAFRRAYAKEVMPVVERFGASEVIVERLAAMRIAGELGTDRAAQFLLDSLGTDDPGIRLFALGRLGRVLRGFHTQLPGLSPDMGKRVVVALGEQIEAVADPISADAGVRALGDATKISDRRFSEVRYAAVEHMANAVGQRLRRTKNDSPDALREVMVGLRACGAARLAIIDQTQTPTAAAARATIRLGGDACGLVHSRRRAGAMTDETRSVDASLLRAGEIAVYFGRSAHARATNGTTTGIPETNLVELFDAGDDRRFKTEIARLLGPESMLVKQLGFKPDRFLRPASDD